MQEQTIVHRGGTDLGITRIRPAYQQVADQLRDLVLTGTLRVGDRLPGEHELAARFGVSRPTVREALRALASQGLVHTERGPSGGTFVSLIEVDGVSEFIETSLGLLTAGPDVTVARMLEARDVLEVPAARFAALRRELHHLVEMREAIEREKRTRGRDDRFSEHRHFHQVVVEASGNVLLGMMNEPVFRVLRAQFLRPTVPDGFWERVDCDHGALLQAVEDRDPDAAGELMSQHLVTLRDAYVD